MLGLIDPGDEIVIFEPFYENYGPDAILSGAVPRYVTLHEPDWSIDPDELRAAVGPRTRAIVVNSPHNPTGKVFSRDELELIASICLEHDLLAFTDDIYEHIVYNGSHIPLATIPGMADRTVSINSMSKTYSVTGWRVGWVIAAPDLSVGVRRAHDFLTVGAAAPLQEAATVAMAMPDSYYEALVAGYRERRDTLLPALAEAGFRAPRAGRGVLRDDRHRGAHVRRRRDVRPAADPRPGRGGGAGLVVLLAAGARSDEAPIRVPEAARDAAGGVGAAGEAGRDRDAGLSGAPDQALSAALATIPVRIATPTLASVPSR